MLAAVVFFVVVVFVASQSFGLLGLLACPAGLLQPLELGAGECLCGTDCGEPANKDALISDEFCGSDGPREATAQLEPELEKAVAAPTNHQPS